MLPKIVLTFRCSNKLFYWSQDFCKFSAAFILKLQAHKNIFFLTERQNNFGNKIPLFDYNMIQVYVTYL